jgi:hypothetical protein
LGNFLNSVNHDSLGRHSGFPLFFNALMVDRALAHPDELAARDRQVSRISEVVIIKPRPAGRCPRSFATEKRPGNLEVRFLG